MSIYLLSFLVLTFLGLQSSDRQARQQLPWIGLFLLWFMGARYYVGCDFASYLNRFDSLPNNFDLWATLRENEGGFHALMRSVKAVGLEFMWVNLIASAIFVVSLSVFCRAHRRPMMILALLFPVLTLQLGMSGVRQALACAFLMMATVAYVRQRRLSVAVLIMAGGLFHSSVLIFLPVAFMPGRDVSVWKIFIAAVLISPLSYLLLESRIETYVDRYIDDVYGEITSDGAFIRYALNAVPALAFIRYRKRLQAAFPDVYSLLQIFTIITFAILPLGILNTTVLHRMNYYVMPVNILTLVYIGILLSPQARISFYRLFPALMYGTYSLMWFLTSRHAESCYTPYRSYTFQ